MTRPLQRGVIKYFDVTKRHGFIAPGGGGTLIFFHERGLCDYQMPCRKGTPVAFHTTVDRGGQVIAVQVRAENKKAAPIAEGANRLTLSNKL